MPFAPKMPSSGSAGSVRDYPPVEAELRTGPLDELDCRGSEARWGHDYRAHWRSVMNRLCEVVA
ncbi:MAG: hypothetical protein ACRDOL_26550 [Streptosporangiaceae bacterium]